MPLARTLPLVTGLLAAAASAAPDRSPTGELVLDLDRPIVAATIAGVPLRLKVALDARDTVELNPDAAAKLPLIFEPAGGIEVGRVTLPGRQARAKGIIAGRPVTLVVETHGRRCCDTSDGMIGPDQMPFRRVRYVRALASQAASRRFPATITPEAGLVAYERVGGEAVAVKLAPDAPDTIATGSAGGIVARAANGRWDGAQRALPLAFGISRPVRPMRLARTVTLLGMPVDALLVRTADFRGGQTLPSDPLPASDITVRGRPRPAQHAWTSITLGRAQLDRCTEIAFERLSTPVLDLRCADVTP